MGKLHKGSKVSQSSFHDVTLLDAPLLEEGNASGASGSGDGVAKRGTTVRILRFGFGGGSPNSKQRKDLFPGLRGLSMQEILWRIAVKVLPCLELLLNYNFKCYFKGDLVAGLSVGFMLIPQGMAYARVAGLNSVYGLYSGYLPSIIYILFGTSRQLAVGPTALVSLLVGESVRQLADGESLDPQIRALHTRLCIMLALMVGSIQLIFGLVRLGWAVRFLSQAVVSGFSSGAAIIIGMTQMRYFLGYRFPRSDKIHIMVLDIIKYIDKLHLPTILVGSVSLCFLLTMKHFGKTYKSLRVLRTAGPIVAVSLGSLFVAISGNPWEIRTVGKIPSGAPSLFLDFPFEYTSSLFIPALVVTGAAYLESISVAKTLAAKNGYSVEASQELVGLGMANIVGSVFSAYPTGGSFSRSAVNNDCGAKTGVAGLISGLLILATILYLTPLFELLPLPVLAAIVMSSVVGLVDYDEAKFLWAVDRRDFVVWMLAFLGTLFCGIQVGVLTAVIISLGFVINVSANAQCEVLGRLPGTTVYRNIEQYPDAKTTPGIVVIHFHSHLYFANVVNFREKLREYENLEGAGGRGARGEGPAPPRVQYVIIDMTAVHAVDSAACHSLMQIHNEYQVRGIRMALANPSHTILDALERAGISDQIGRQWFFVRIYDAVRLCRAEMLRRQEAKIFPTSSGVPLPGGPPGRPKAPLSNGGLGGGAHGRGGGGGGGGGGAPGGGAEAREEDEEEEHDPDIFPPLEIVTSSHGLPPRTLLSTLPELDSLGHECGDDDAFPDDLSPRGEAAAVAAAAAAAHPHFMRNLSLPVEISAKRREADGRSGAPAAAVAAAADGADGTHAHSAPEIGVSAYILPDELESDLGSEGSRVRICGRCRGMLRVAGGGRRLPLAPQHLLIADCLCRSGLGDGLDEYSISAESARQSD